MVELSELLLQRRCNQRRGRESLSPVDHTVAHQGDGVASAVEGRSKLLVKDGIEGFTVTATVVVSQTRVPAASTRAALRLELPRLMTRASPVISARRS